MAVPDFGELSFFLAVLVEGMMAGAIYGLIALAFVLVYKCSRMVNFAVGEWVIAGALAAGLGYSALDLGAVGAILFAVLAMAGFGLAFNAVVVRRVAAGPVITLIMVTLGLGALMRGLSMLLFRDVPAGVPLALPTERCCLPALRWCRRSLSRPWRHWSPSPR